MEPAELARPLSAPGSLENANDEDETTIGTNDTDNNSVKVAFKEMEERAEGAMGKENRGHKLPVGDLVDTVRRNIIATKRTKSIATPQTEEECKEIEKEFCQLQHYRQDSATAGLETSQVKLLYSSWARFSTNSQLRRALFLPEKLWEAGESIPVKHTLAGTAISVVSEGLIKVIENVHVQHKAMLQLVESLSRLLSDMEDGPKVPDSKISFDNNSNKADPGNEADDGDNGDDDASRDDDIEPLLSVLALAQDNLKSTEKLLKLLGKSRAGLINALEYGHLIGRFLVKRNRKFQLKKSAIT